MSGRRTCPHSSCLLAVMVLLHSEFSVQNDTLAGVPPMLSLFTDELQIVYKAQGRSPVLSGRRKSVSGFELCLRNLAYPLMSFFFYIYLFILLFFPTIYSDHVFPPLSTPPRSFPSLSPPNLMLLSLKYKATKPKNLTQNKQTNKQDKEVRS